MSSSPAQIGPYLLDFPLGQGAMGIVYRATHTETRQVVALKTLALSAQPDTYSVHALRREIQALSRVQHPGVVAVLDAGVAQNIPWFAMELLDAVPLWLFSTSLRPTTESAATRPIVRMDPRDLPRSGPDPLASSRRAVVTLRSDAELSILLGIMQKLCMALAFLHSENIVHRDLKPDNILVRPCADPVLVDFGLVSESAQGRRDALSTSHIAAGTALYISPEQARGELVDARSDLYAVGCVLYEIATGRPPFQRPRSGAVVNAHLNTPPTPPSAHRPNLSPQLERLILSLLEKDRRRRVGRAEDVAQVLGDIIDAPLERLPEAWSIHRLRAPVLYRPGFVGRAGTLTSLRRDLKALVKSEGGVRLITGEGGQGKTRLLVELSRVAAAYPLTLLSSTCEASTRRPLEGLHGILQGIVDHCRQGGAEETAHVLAARGPLLSRYEPDFSLLPGQTTPPKPNGAPAPEARMRLFNALCETLEALAQRAPLLLIIDDLQWVDELTLSWLRHIQTHHWLASRPIALLGAIRTEEITPPIEALLRTTPQITVLPPLDPEHIDAIVCELLGVATPPPELTRYLAMVSNGNPFHLTQYLQTAIEEGLLTRAPGQPWTLAVQGTSAELPLPQDAQALVRRRLDNLSSLESTILDVAAVFGRDIDDPFLREVLSNLGIEVTLDALDALDALLGRHLLEESSPGVYRFVNRQIQTITYARLSLSLRVSLHAAIVAALETRPDTEPLTLAEHAFHAERWAQATDHFILAAESARRLGAFRSAGAHYTRALQALGHQQSTPRTLRRHIDTTIDLVQVTWRSERPNRNLEQLRKARLLTARLKHSRRAQPDDQRRSTRIDLWICRTLLLQSRPDEALDLALQLRDELSSSSDDLDSHASVFGLIARAHVHQGHFLGALSAFQRAPFQWTQRPRALEWLLNGAYLALALHATGASTSGHAHLEHVLSCARDARLQAAQAFGLLIRALIALLFDADHPRAARDAQDALALASASNDGLYIHLAHGLLAWIAARQGEPELGRRHLILAQEASEPLGHPLMFSDLLAVARAEVALCADASAIDLAHDAHVQAARIGNLFSEGLALHALAEASRRVGDANADADWRAQAFNCFERTGLTLLARTLDDRASGRHQRVLVPNLPIDDGQ